MYVRILAVVPPIDKHLAYVAWITSFHKLLFLLFCALKSLFQSHLEL